jgi:two-component system OmpR family response regulator
MRILVVEDDEKIASFIVNGLKQSGFAVDIASDGETALSLCEVVTYDAIVLDIMLPKLDGLSVVRRVRRDKRLVPVLLLSAMASVDNRVAGLQAGADDYLTKPFAFSELLARLQALIRRASHVTEPTTLVVGDLSMNLLTREVIRAGQRPGRPVTKTMILEHVWDYSFDPQTNVVDVLAHRLRTKLERNFTARIMHTIRGVGYVLKIP